MPIKDQVYGVVYIDNGFAEIELSLSDQIGRMRLPIDAVPPDSVGEDRPGLPVHLAGYQFSLLELTPMREEAGQVFPDSEYVATILIEPDTLPPAVSGDFFPLETGNSWTYADTVWVNGSITTETYDVAVMHQFQDVLGTWWQLSHATDFLYSWDASIMLRRDSVYLRQSGEFFRPYGSCWSYPMLFYIEPENAVDTFYSLVEGDIANTRYVRLITDTSIIVPAGEFTTVYEFSGNFWIYSDCRIYFAPRVGVLLFEASGYFQDRRAVLVSYSLQN
ncbi:MAG: hypothetical protein JSV52_03285 [Candidatus Zixiibacteriota bacterium]|nr:MAG: hypothetical protein JSV52_03285 [candidate division Zixibacteria bacterium]